MRNLKKFLAMALTVLMVVGSFSALTVNAAFDDVTDYQEAIDVMSTLGIIKGYDAETFGPDDDVTRWQMALLITKMMTGKVSDEYVNTNLKNPENLTAFTDITAENYIGAINYANNNGIVKGATATTYAPNAGIKVQDVFTMVVRMLGYGSTAMDNNYPWSYIDKAISLGLDAGLPIDYSNEAIATRGEVAQILFNALTAVKADASTLGADFFNLQKATVVITGTKKANMYNNAAVVTKTVDGVDYVAFCKLSAEGTVDSSYTYYLPKTAFGLAADANANAFVGDSFVVRTNDDFASLLTCEACEKTYIDQDALVGLGTSSSDNANITINGDKYTLVKSYTYLGNGQGAKNTNTEIILNNANGTRSTSYATDYVLDKNLNILDEDGKILLHWVTTYGLDVGIHYANLNGTYLYQVGTDANDDPLYVEPNDYIWSLAARATLVADRASGFGAITKSYAEIEKLDAYSTTVLYDDDADGDYDRGVYYQFVFGKAATYTKDSAAWLKITTSGKTPVDDKVANLAFYNAEGKAITADSINGKYVLYYYQQAYKTVIVKEVFAGQTGLVTGINLATKTLTLNGLGVNLITGIVAGENLTIGNAKLSGATFNDIVGTYDALKSNQMIGKNVNYIEKDGKILAIYNYADAANYMVFVDNNIGYTTMGYQTALVYFDPIANKYSNTRATVTINAIGNVWYNNNLATFNPGDLLAATKDALGNYDVKAQAYDKNGVTGKITFVNGVLNSALTNSSTNKADDLAPGKATADTVIIVFDGIDFDTFKGIPANGAEINTLATGADIKYDVDSNGNIKFLYVNGGTMGGNTTPGNPWNLNQTSTIVYVDANAIMTQDGTNVLNYGAGMYLGTVYNYSKLIDVINGGYVDAKWSSNNFNTPLAAGNFYEVKDGWIAGPATGMTKVFLSESYKSGTNYTTTTNAATYANSFATVYYLQNGAVVTKNSALFDALTAASTDNANCVALKAALQDGDVLTGYNAWCYTGTDYPAFDSFPIFIAEGGLVVKEASVPALKYHLQVKAYDDGGVYVSTDAATCLAATDKSEKIDVYLNSVDTTPLTLAQIAAWGDCYGYSHDDTQDFAANKLPIVIVAVGDDIKDANGNKAVAKVTFESKWDIANKQAINVDMTPSKVEHDDANRVTYYYYQLSEDMVCSDWAGNLYTDGGNRRWIDVAIVVGAAN